MRNPSSCPYEDVLSREASSTTTTQQEDCTESVIAVYMQPGSLTSPLNCMLVTAVNNDPDYNAVLAKRHQVCAMHVNSLQTGLF